MDHFRAPPRRKPTDADEPFRRQQFRGMETSRVPHFADDLPDRDAVNEVRPSTRRVPHLVEAGSNPSRHIEYNSTQTGKSQRPPAKRLPRWTDEDMWNQDQSAEDRRPIDVPELHRDLREMMARHKDDRSHCYSSQDFGDIFLPAATPFTFVHSHSAVCGHDDVTSRDCDDVTSYASVTLNRGSDADDEDFRRSFQSFQEGAVGRMTSSGSLQAHSASNIPALDYIPTHFESQVCYTVWLRQNTFWFPGTFYHRFMSQHILISRKVISSDYRPCSSTFRFPFSRNDVS